MRASTGKNTTSKRSVSLRMSLSSPSSVFLRQGIDLRAEFGWDASGRRGIGQKAGIPVAEVAGMKQAFALDLDNPAYAAIVAAGGPHFQVFVLPTCTFGQPHVGLSCLCPAVFQHVLRKQVGDTGHLLTPGKNARGKVVLVKMTDEDVDGLRLVGAEYARNDIRGVEPDSRKRAGRLRFRPENRCGRCR